MHLLHQKGSWDFAFINILIFHPSIGKVNVAWANVHITECSFNPVKGDVSDSQLNAYFSSQLRRLTACFSGPLRRLTAYFSAPFSLTFSAKSANLGVKGGQLEFLNLFTVFRKLISFIYKNLFQGDRVPLRRNERISEPRDVKYQTDFTFKGQKKEFSIFG